MNRKLSGFEQWECLKVNLQHHVGEDAIVQRIEAGKRLRVKLGVDPTRPDLTFGHWVVFNKLRQFQDFGHEVVLLIGDYTAQIGDPSGRSSTRPALTPEKVEENASTYLRQAFKILQQEQTTVCRNGEWLGKLSSVQLLDLTRRATVAQLLEREDFTNRYRDKTPISLMEFMYPLLQGYDSVALGADVEIGGTDQLFNMLMGRHMQREFGQEAQAVLCLPLLVGLDGQRKMSKTYDNYITFNDPPSEMFGKTMSLPDNVMGDYFRLLLEESEDQTAGRKSLHPMATKKELAQALVARFYGEESGRKARENFEALFSKKIIPEDVPEFSRRRLRSITLIDILSETGLTKASRNELKRIFAQGGVEVDGHKIVDPFFTLPADKPLTIRIGKRVFFKLTAP
ncbi:MAG: tyrosine--tRNA ligase [Puniceicoccales bacterium]|nr:tyrosine--tRNA ligase [Puniceicoccales bacterium]